MLLRSVTHNHLRNYDFINYDNVIYIAAAAVILEFFDLYGEGEFVVNKGYLWLLIVGTYFAHIF